MNYFLGEIRLFAFNRIPQDWVACTGQLLPIQQYAALFSLLGTVFGGNGTTTFGIPDLRGRTPFGVSGTMSQGALAGTESVSLTLAQLPPHTHNMLVNSAGGTTSLDTGNFLAANATGGATAFNVYAQQSGHTAQPLHPSSVTPMGSGSPHENRQPSLALSYCISTQGIFPNRP